MGKQSQHEQESICKKDDIKGDTGHNQVFTKDEEDIKSINEGHNDKNNYKVRYSPAMSTVSRSLSLPRKWNPPVFLTKECNSTNSCQVKASRTSLAATMVNQTPRLRVGLTRKYKSPKPLHSSLKWTP